MGITQAASLSGWFETGMFAGKFGNAIGSGLVGGTASVAAGGDFAMGAVQGAMSRFLNDRLHEARYKKILEAGEIDLNANANAAGEISDFEFVRRVKPGGAWDYKNYPPLISALETAGNYNPALLAEFGNWHFGYVSAAHGYSLGFSLMGAGVTQSFIQGGGNPGQALIGATIFHQPQLVRPLTQRGMTWGDRADDPKPIMQGWDAYHGR